MFQYTSKILHLCLPYENVGLFFCSTWQKEGEVKMSEEREREREREGERERERDRQTDRQTNKQRHRQTERRAARQADRQTEESHRRGWRCQLLWWRWMCLGTSCRTLGNCPPRHPPCRTRHRTPYIRRSRSAHTRRHTLQYNVRIMKKKRNVGGGGGISGKDRTWTDKLDSYVHKYINFCYFVLQFLHN